VENNIAYTNLDRNLNTSGTFGMIIETGALPYPILNNNTWIISNKNYGNITFYRSQCKLQFFIGNDDAGVPIQIISDNAVGLQISSSGYLNLSASVIGINDILRLTPRSTTPTPVEGMIIASGSAGASILYYYNGTAWNALF
jgi:hypothetical protein